MQILKQDINRRILAVARHVFSQRGFAKASMRDIAAKVGAAWVLVICITTIPARMICFALCLLRLSLPAMPCLTSITVSMDKMSFQ
ncbi:hypothetical protein IMSAGC006_00858 [Muribaculaceae bacterium]|nr:hypothetical protein IMSAGC006_00858 [Muribaculaceae bacterium]